MSATGTGRSEATGGTTSISIPSPAWPPATPWKFDGHAEAQVVAIFCFFDPHRGWRRVTTRDSRTRLDWAEEVRHLLDVEYPKAKKIRLVCDNLNTHGIASLYEAFPAEEAHRLARRLVLHHTPRNGSWLNVAEIELSVLAKQCLDRRIGSATEPRPRQGGMAVHHPRCPRPAKTPLPTALG